MGSDDNDDDVHNGKRRAGSATTVRPAHKHTNAPQMLGGHTAMAKKLVERAASGTTGKKVGGGASKRGMWDVTSQAPKWAPLPAIRLAGKRAVVPHPVALTLECARASALERLRKKLNAAATAAGAGAPPPQAFERWRFAAKLAEDAAATCAAAGALDPVIPGGRGGGRSDDCVLTADLKRAGVAPEAAENISEKIVADAAADAAAVRKLHSRLTTTTGASTNINTKGTNKKKKKKTKDREKGTSSDDAEDEAKTGGASSPSTTEVKVRVTFRKHSVELTASKGGHFVVLSRQAYGKLAAMYRRNTPSIDPGLPPLSSTNRRGVVTKSDDDDDEDNEDGAHALENEEVTAAAEECIIRSSGRDLKDDDDVIDAAAGDDEEKHPPPGRVAFHARLFVLLLRYKSIQGYGFQASVGPDVFHTLHTATGAAFECFASPLNTFFGRFCGAFPDVDAPFGSSGDFFNLPTGALKRGCFQANPPFVSAVMTAMAERIEKALKTAEKDEQPLSFVVFVPGWTDEPSWSAMKTSDFCRSHFVVAAGDHGYCDGAAHQRKDVYRTSVYDTGVFVLQSSRAAASAVGRHIAAGPKSSGGGGGGRVKNDNNKIVGRFEAELREAMASARVAAVGMASAGVLAADNHRNDGGGVGGNTVTWSGGAGRHVEKQNSKKRSLASEDDGEDEAARNMKRKKKREEMESDDEEVEDEEDDEDESGSESGSESEKKDDSDKKKGKLKKKKNKNKRKKHAVESKAAKKRRKRREAAGWDDGIKKK